MPRFESRTEQIRNARLIEQRELAAERIVASSVWTGVGALLTIYGVTLDPLPWWIAFSIASIVCLLRGVIGLVMYIPLYLQPITPDEVIQRVYSGEEDHKIRIEARDGHTLRLTDLGLKDARDAALVVKRLQRADWYWSRRVLEGKANEETITNLNTRYPEMLTEMQRVGALYQDGRRWRVAEWAREQLSPTPPANS